MTHSQLAADLRRFLDEERFEEAERLLPDYAGTVLNECACPDDLLQACDFLRCAARAVRARRAHYLCEISEAARRQAYLSCDSRSPNIDYDG